MALLNPPAQRESLLHRNTSVDHLSVAALFREQQERDPFQSSLQPLRKAVRCRECPEIQSWPSDSLSPSTLSWIRMRQSCRWSIWCKALCWTDHRLQSVKFNWIRRFLKLIFLSVPWCQWQTGAFLWGLCCHVAWPAARGWTKVPQNTLGSDFHPCPI